LESNILSIPLIPLIASKKLENFHVPSNPSGLVIVLNAHFDTEEYQVFLEKVFQAVGLDLNSQVTKIVLNSGECFSLSEHEWFANIQRVIFFGVSPTDCGIHYALRPYQMISYDHRQYLLSDQLDEIINTPTLKKDLWVALQQLLPKEI